MFLSKCLVRVFSIFLALRNNTRMSERVVAETKDLVRATCNGRIVSSRTITIQLTASSRDEVWWLSVTVSKGCREEGVVLLAVLHCPHHNQCASCRPAFLVGLVRLPFCPHAVCCYRYWFKWPDRVSLLCTDPSTDWFSDRSTQERQWCSNGGLEVVRMGTVYLHCTFFIIHLLGACPRPSCRHYPVHHMNKCWFSFGYGVGYCGMWVWATHNADGGYVPPKQFQLTYHTM